MVSVEGGLCVSGASDVELARFETDDTDGVVPGGLLSTTQESFSEHAWDPYQVRGIEHSLPGRFGRILNLLRYTTLNMTYLWLLVTL